MVTERRRAIRAAIIEAAETALPGPFDELQGRYNALEDRFGRVLRNPSTTPVEDIELLEGCAAALAGLDADVCRLLSAPAAFVCETAVTASTQEAPQRCRARSSSAFDILERPGMWRRL